MYSGSFGFGEADLKSSNDAELLERANRLPPAPRARLLGDKAEEDVTLYGDACYDVLGRYRIDAVMSNVSRFQESEKLFLGISETLRDIATQLENVKEAVETLLQPEAPDLIKALEAIRGRAGEIMAQGALLSMLFQKNAPTLVDAHAICLTNVFLYRVEEATIYVGQVFRSITSLYLKMKEEEDEDSPVISVHLAGFIKSLVVESLLPPMDALFTRISAMANPELQSNKEIREMALSVLESELAKLWLPLKGALDDGKISAAPVRRRIPEMIEELSSKVEKFESTFSSRKPEEEDDKSDEEEDYGTVRRERVTKAARDMLYLGKPKVMLFLQQSFSKLAPLALEEICAKVPNEFVAAALRGYLQFILDYVPPVESIRESLDVATRFEDQMALFQASEGAEVFSDVRFVFDEHRTLRAHKVILSAHSDTFRRMFSSGFRERDAHEVPIKEVTQDIFTLMLKFIYANGNINIANELQGRGLILGHQLTQTRPTTHDDQLEAALSLLEASHHYVIAALHRQAETLIMSFAKDIDVNDILPIYTIAEACAAPRLQRLCRDLLLRYNERLKPDVLSVHHSILDQLKFEMPHYWKGYDRLTIFVVTDPALPKTREQELLAKIFSANYNDEMTLAAPKKHSSGHPTYTKYLELTGDRTFRLEFVILPSLGTADELYALTIGETDPAMHGNPCCAFVLFYDVNLTEWVLEQKALIENASLEVLSTRDTGDEPEHPYSAFSNVLLVADATSDPGTVAALQLKRLEVELAAVGSIYSSFSLSQALDEAFLNLLANHFASSSCTATNCSFLIPDFHFH